MHHLKNHFFSIFLLLLLSGTILFLSNIFTNGYLSSPVNMGAELWSLPQQLHEWKLSYTEPFKYRLLFPWLVKTSYQMINSHNEIISFYFIYNLWTYITLFYAVISFYILTVNIYKDKLFIIITFILFFTSSPLLFSHTLPVHTREDFLAYGLLCNGLYFIINKKIWEIILLSSFSVLCRETLLILPFLFLFFTSTPKSFLKRAIISLIPIIVYISLRNYMGNHIYDIWVGLRWNLKNPIQAFVFIFISFHFLWVIFIVNIFTNSISHNEKINFLKKSSLSVFLMVFMTTFLFGIFNEIRLLFLLFPWIIIINAYWIRLNIDTLKSQIANVKQYKFYILITSTFLITVSLISLKSENLFVFNKHRAMSILWLYITIFYLYISALVVPCIYRTFKNTNYHEP